LHEQGYTFFNINKLTYQEIDLLIRAFNTKQKDLERAMKRNKKKYRR